MAMRAAAATALSSHPDRVPLPSSNPTQTDIYGFGFDLGSTLGSQDFGGAGHSASGAFLSSYYDMPFASIPEDEVYICSLIHFHAI